MVDLWSFGVTRLHAVLVRIHIPFFFKFPPEKGNHVCMYSSIYIHPGWQSIFLLGFRNRHILFVITVLWYPSLQLGRTSSGLSLETIWSNQVMERPWPLRNYLPYLSFQLSFVMEHNRSLIFDLKKVVNLFPINVCNTLQFGRTWFLIWCSLCLEQMSGKIWDRVYISILDGKTCSLSDFAIVET